MKFESPARIKDFCLVWFDDVEHDRGNPITIIDLLPLPPALAGPVQFRQETVGEMMLRVTGIDIALCPKCGQGKLKLGKPLGKTRSIQCRAPT